MAFTTVWGTQLETLHIAGDTARAPLVFLHEGLGSVAMWRDFPAQVCAATGREAWVYSRQGYGQSSPIADVRGAGQRSAHYMHHEAWAVLPALFSALGIQQPLLLGHSDGATIALLYASRHSVAGCIAMAPHVMVEHISLHSIAAARQAYEHGDLRQRLAKHHADVDSAFWQWNDVWLSDAFRNFDIRPQCASITASLLLIQGQDDPYGTMAQIDEIKARAPHAHTLKLANCGHNPHKEQAQAVVLAIESFLADLD